MTTVEGRLDSVRSKTEELILAYGGSINPQILHQILRIDAAIEDANIVFDALSGKISGNDAYVLLNRKRVYTESDKDIKNKNTLSHVLMKRLNMET